jgi:hypothetical protein
MQWDDSDDSGDCQPNFNDVLSLRGEVKCMPFLQQLMKVPKALSYVRDRA